MFTLIKDSSNHYQMAKDGKNLPPGLLQYKVKKDDIINLDIRDCQSLVDRYEFAEHSESNLLRLTPNTKTGKANKWKIVLIIKNKESACMKSVLQNQKRPNEYALMTSINKELIYNHRTVNSLDVNYKICFCKMIAPSKFWKEFKNRLLY
jgi:hypothetical protein